MRECRLTSSLPKHRLTFRTFVIFSSKLTFDEDAIIFKLFTLILNISFDIHAGIAWSITCPFSYEEMPRVENSEHVIIRLLGECIATTSTISFKKFDIRHFIILGELIHSHCLFLSLLFFFQALWTQIYNIDLLNSFRMSSSQNCVMETSLFKQCLRGIKVHESSHI